MSANINPIFGRTPDVQLGGAVLGSAANTSQDGSGANITSIFQADATEGGWVEEIRLKPVGSPAATVIRVFICNVTGTFTAGTSNSASTASMIAEVACPAITSSNVNAQIDLSIPIRRALSPGYRLLMTFGTSTGSSGTGFAVSTWGVKY